MTRTSNHYILQLFLLLLEGFSFPVRSYSSQFLCGSSRRREDIIVVLLTEFIICDLKYRKKMNGLTGKGIPIAGTGIVIYGPEVLGPPKIVIREGSFPVGDYQHWVSYHVPVYGISCDSFLDLYVQLNGEETNMVLDRVSDYVERVPTVTQIKTDFAKTPGSPCLAQFEDDSWYRAKIVEDLGDELFKVNFVDYGNCFTVKSDKLMHCPDDLVDFVEGVTHVALHGYTGDETKEEIKALSKFIVETDLIAKVESNSFEVKGKTRMLVTLFTAEGQPIRSLVDDIIKTSRTLQENEEVSDSKQSPHKEDMTVHKDVDVVSENSAVVPQDLVQEEKQESPPLLIPPVDPKEEFLQTISEPELSANEVELTVVVSQAVPETSCATASVVPSLKIKKFEQFEDAVDSGPVTIPRKSSLTSAVIFANTHESDAPSDPEKMATDDFLLEKESWRIEKLSLEKRIEDQMKDSETKDQIIAEYCLKVDGLAREIYLLKSECSNKEDSINLLNTRLQKVHEELVSREGAAQLVQHLEAQSANQLGEISNLRSIINAMQGSVYQVQVELEGKKSELESQIQFNGELLAKKQNLAKELSGQKLLEKELRSQETTLKNEMKELSKTFEQQTEKLVEELKLKDIDLNEALNALKDVKKENEELREHLLNAEQEFETKLGKTRSSVGSLVDVSTLTPRSPGLPPDYEKRVTEQKLAVERLTETLAQIVKTNALEARFQQAKIDHLSVELAARNTHYSSILRHDQ
ncbi:unnamed protein product [Allacma fusca]|uniref:Tudor domain-containing protein n=1 Tax=Allacma fusca TaxID=39272 RepID=A0A8J2NP03_9HEXA|nr:unnamed protein product [Allacma fusca]